MNIMIPRNIRVLGVDPRSRGLGYAVLERPFCLVDWGVKTVRNKKKRRTLAMITGLIRRYKPYVIVLEDCEGTGSRRCARIEKLIGAICREAVKDNVAVRVFSRANIKEVFGTFGATTKYEIALAIAKQLPELTPHLPRYRKVWMNEDYRMAFFNAASLALTYLYTRQMREKR
jgi:Holliday junction resolvasome RuvABC endonuclease subunit